MTKLSHISTSGHARMVDVSAKDLTLRTAKAVATVCVSPEVLRAIQSNAVSKGNVLTIAQIAGIQAAKRTAELIPLCHTIMLSDIAIEFTIDEAENLITITSLVTATAPTGVEMEALTAASLAALTIYDMCKSIDKSIVIREIKLLSKTGGKSGTYTRQ